ncbi:MAG TPA: enolase C-terminal domain-like protein [Chloroflexota bacterium]|nr:enolase C-terminal domain-like protein [Chloroflexota bacterium]
MSSARIVSVEWGTLTGQRPRPAGSNARLGAHGSAVQVPLVRIRTGDGACGFGVGRPSPDLAAALLGVPLDQLFDPAYGVPDRWMPVEYALWDLAARRAAVPVYALAASLTGRPAPGALRVPCYDTSLYFDDLHLSSIQEASQLIAAEAREGYERGHRAFKVKVGRGARHLPVEEGTQRDIAVIRAVRDSIGPDCRLLIDANNGYTLNLAKRVLSATADCRVYWLEEAFHEDGVLYQDLRAWLADHGLPALLADGEGDASPRLLDWAKQRLIDVIQYDIVSHGFTRWLHTGRQLDEWQARSAPHHYGGYFGNYAACHLAPALRGFTYVEWDEATVPGLEAPGYTIAGGAVSVPAVPGFGLNLDELLFQRVIDANGFRATAS